MKFILRHAYCLFLCMLAIPVVATNIVFADPFLEIKEFVLPDSPQRIQQVKNSKWCVPTCVDIASAYVSRISGAPLSDLTVLNNILVNGAVNQTITEFKLDLSGHFKAIETGAKLIANIPQSSKTAIKDLVYDLGGSILTFDQYKSLEGYSNFFINVLYKRSVDGDIPKWTYNKKAGTLIGAYLSNNQEFSTIFTEKENEQQVDDTVKQFVAGLSEDDIHSIYFLNLAIPCLWRSLLFPEIPNTVTRWFQDEALVKKIGNIQCECEVKDATRVTQAVFDNIFANAAGGNTVILDFVCADTDRTNHACIVVGAGEDVNGKWLEVYNPDPNYAGNNPMLVTNSLTYTISGNKSRVLSRYVIVTTKR